jgi:hypothetical protein
LVYYDVIQDKAFISIDFQSQNLQILDFDIDKEFEIIFYLCTDNRIYFFNAVDTIINNKYSSTDSKYWFGSNVSSTDILYSSYKNGKLFYDSSKKILAYLDQFTTFMGNSVQIRGYSLSRSKMNLTFIGITSVFTTFKLNFSNLKFSESSSIVYGKMSTDYFFAFLIFPLTIISLQI